MRHIAIIGSGPAGYYTAEAAQKHWGDDVRIDIFDSLPVPYGLIRTGVAPDSARAARPACRLLPIGPSSVGVLVTTNSSPRRRR